MSTLSPAQELLERIIERATLEYKASAESGFGEPPHCAATEETLGFIQGIPSVDVDLLLHLAALEIAAWRLAYPDEISGR